MYDSKLDALTWNLAPFFGHCNPQMADNDEPGIFQIHSHTLWSAISRLPSEQSRRGWRHRWKADFGFKMNAPSVTINVTGASSRLQTDWERAVRGSLKGRPISPGSLEKRMSGTQRRSVY